MKEMQIKPERWVVDLVCLTKEFNLNRRDHKD